MHVKSLHIYPLKGARAVDLQYAELRQRGLAGDRRFMLVKKGGRFVSQRKYPQMAQISVSLHEGEITMRLPGQAERSVPLPKADKRINISLWADEFTACFVDNEINFALSEFLGEQIKLVYMDDKTRRLASQKWAGGKYPVSFADGYPVLVTSTSSLAAINRYLANNNKHILTMDRFRPNIVIDGADEWAENNWQRIKIGAAELKLVKPCARCIVTSIDQSTGKPGRKTALSALKTLNPSTNPANPGVIFGHNAVVTKPGQVRLSDKVVIL